MNITTDKEAYKFVTEELLSQKEKSKDSDGECKYRGHTQSVIDEVMNRVTDELEITEYEDTDQFYTEYENLIGNEPFNLKCAVGHLIKESVYEYHYEGQVIEYKNLIFEAVQKSNPDWKMDEFSCEMLKQLQIIHDQKQESEWLKLFLDFGDKFTDEGKYDPTLW